MKRETCATVSPHDIDTTLKSLDRILEQVRKVEDLLSGGGNLAALRLLLEIRKSLRQIVVVLVVQCLRKNLETIDGEDQHSRETRTQDLFEMLKFILLALCLNCQKQIGAELKEA